MGDAQIDAWTCNNKTTHRRRSSCFELIGVTKMSNEFKNSVVFLYAQQVPRVFIASFLSLYVKANHGSDAFHGSVNETSIGCR